MIKKEELKEKAKNCCKRVFTVENAAKAFIAVNALVGSFVIGQKIGDFIVFDPNGDYGIGVETLKNRDEIRVALSRKNRRGKWIDEPGVKARLLDEDMMNNLIKLLQDAQERKGVYKN